MPLTPTGRSLPMQDVMKRLTTASNETIVNIEKAVEAESRRRMLDTEEVCPLVDVRVRVCVWVRV